MLERLSNKFACRLIHAEIISKSDADIYMYGFFQLIMMTLNIMTTLLLGMLFHLLISCILLNLSYIPIRINAGGHHADSPIKCYIDSTIMNAVLLIVVKWFPIHIFVSITLFFLSGILICILAPVETKNNPWSKAEKVGYRKRTRIILGIEIIVSAIALIFKKNWIFEVIMLGIFTEGLMLLIGKWNIIISKEK